MNGDDPHRRRVPPPQGRPGQPPLPPSDGPAGGRRPDGPAPRRTPPRDGRPPAADRRRPPLDDAYPHPPGDRPAPGRGDRVAPPAGPHAPPHRPSDVARPGDRRDPAADPLAARRTPPGGPGRRPVPPPADGQTVRHTPPSDRRPPASHIEPTQVMHRDGRGDAPLAYSQMPPREQLPPREHVKARQPHAQPPPRREPLRHAPTQRPVPHHDSLPPRRTPPPSEAGRQPQPPRRRRRRHPLRWFLVLVVLLVVGLVAGIVHLDNSLTRIDALTSYSDRVGNTPGTNWLLVGSDSRGDLTPEQEQELATGGDIDGTERTDTIMLVHIPGSGPTTMVSLPRDSYVSIPGYGKDKLNASFALGGPELLVQTVEQATGVRIDHYAQIGFGGFASVVDALGGIDVCLDDPIVDPLAGLDLPAGCQRLTGPQALGFVRTRATPRADVDRMNHQRIFMSALLKKATSMGTLANPFALWPMATGVAGSLKVDEGDHIWNLAALGWAMRGDTVTTSVPIGGFDDTDVGNVLLWDKAKAPDFFDAIANDRPIPEDLLTR